MHPPMALSRAEIGGVPVFWADTGGDPAAGLIFRVGRADEMLATSGITHLAEHLALYPLGLDTRQHHNGQVAAAATTFTVRGGPGRISEFFGALCASLRDLPVARLEDEKRVLRTEEAGRGAAADALLVRRYGAAGYGLAGLPEYGLKGLTPETVTEWVRAWFTRGNAALWLTCPPPDGLRLDLPDGPAMPPPPPTSALPDLPAYFHAAAGGVACSGVVTRSAAATVYQALLQQRLRQELRHRQALSYSPAVSYSARDRQAAHLLAVADGLAESMTRLVSAFTIEVERLGAALASEAEVRAAAAALAEARGTPAGMLAQLVFTARNAVMGLASSSAADWQARLLAVTPDGIRDVAREMLGSALFMLPPGTSLFRDRYVPAVPRPAGVAAGRRIRSRDHPIVRSRLIAGAAGASLIHQGEVVATVSAADCAALLTWPDGGRELVGTDGASVRLEPTLWRLRPRDITQLEAAVPAACRVAMPRREPGQVPRPQTRRLARIAARLLFGPVQATLAGLCLPVAGLVILVTADHHAARTGAAILIPAMAVGALAGQWAWTRAQQSGRRPTR